MSNPPFCLKTDANNLCEVPVQSRVLPAPTFSDLKSFEVDQVYIKTKTPAGNNKHFVIDTLQ